MLAKIGFDTAENGPLKLCQKLDEKLELNRGVESATDPAAEGFEAVEGSDAVAADAAAASYVFFRTPC